MDNKTWPDNKRCIDPVLNEIGMIATTFIADIILKPVTLAALENSLNGF